MPELPSTVDYATFHAHVCKGEGSLFGWLEELAKSGQKATVRQLCETWFDLLTTDAIQHWLLSSNWAVSDREHDFQVLDPVLSLLLRRHLLHLGTRRDVSKLSGFWRWATKLVPKLAECWDGVRFNLTLLPDQSVAQQEAAFVTLLTEMDRALDEQHAYAAFPWVQSVLGRVLTERRLPPPGERAAQATVHVVFAMHDQHELLRPGIVVTFRLLSDADPQSFLQPAEVFDAAFRQSLTDVRNLVGFTDLRVMAHDWGWLPVGFLKDTSGSLAIWLAQHLAAGHEREDRYTLPPWLVMSATLDPRGSGIGGGAAPVGLLPAKLQTLVEEGVRVVLTANPGDEVQAAWRQVQAASGVAETDLQFVSIAGDLSQSQENRSIVQSVAKRVRDQQWIWPVDFPVPPKPAEPTSGPVTNVSKKVASADDQLTGWKAQFVPPVYILERLEQARASLSEGRGYVELIAPSMWGKSRLSVALREGWLKDGTCASTVVPSLRRRESDGDGTQSHANASQHVPSAERRDYSTHVGRIECTHPTADWVVLGYSIVPGLVEVAGNFLHEIHRCALRLPRSDGWGKLDDAALPRPHDLQTVNDIRQAFLRLLSVVQRECCAPHQPLVLSIDGVDELVRTRLSADNEQPDLLKYLPTASELPEGVFILLTRRSGPLTAGVRRMLDVYAPPSHRRTVELTSEHDAADQDAVMRTFVTQSLIDLWPESPTVERDELLTAILERSARQFLKAQLLIDTFGWQPTADLPSPASLPNAEAIFSYALESLSQRVARLYRDAEWFEHWHRAILGFVTAAFEPIRREHLRAWLPQGGCVLLPVPLPSEASSTETGKSDAPDRRTVVPSLRRTGPSRGWVSHGVAERPADGAAGLQ